MARTRPWLMLAVALASGGLAALLAMRYLRQQAQPLAQPVRSRMVVAARPLPVGTVVQEQHSRPSNGRVARSRWGTSATRPTWSAAGLISDLQENEPVLESSSRPRAPAAGFPSSSRRECAALTMRVNEVSGVSGFVTPNTRVDVLLTMEDKTNTGGEPATRIIMQDMKVLAAGQSIQPDKEGKPQSVPVVTFLVTPEQAETLALASQQGSIQLALRNPLDTMPVKTTGTRRSVLMGGPVGRPRSRGGPG